MMEKYFSPEEAARYAGTTRLRLWLLIKRGRLRAYRDPRVPQIKLLKRSELEAALNLSPSTPPNSPPPAGGAPPSPRSGQ